MASKKEKALKAANRFLQKGQVDKAIREYEKILAIDARDPRIRHKYAELLARKGRRDDALEEFRWVAEYYQQGGFYPKAIAIFKQMLGLDSESIEVHLQLGQIYHGQRKVSDATIHFQKAAAMVERSGTLQQKLEVHERLYMLSPNDLDAAWRLVAMYTGSAQPQKAMELLTRMAERLRTAGELDKLLSVLDRLAGIADEPTAYLKEMAYVLLQRGKPDSAINKLQLCFKKDPQDTETLELLGRAFQEQGESEKAIQVFEELSRILTAAGDERAAEIEERIQSLRPQEVVISQEEPSEEFSDSAPLELPEELTDEALLHIVRGETFLRYGLVDRAKIEGNEAVQNWPDMFASHQLRARSLIRLARPEDAVDSYMQMYSIAMDRGAIPAARGCLAETVRLTPGDAGAVSRLDAFDDAMGEQLRTWTDDMLLPQAGAAVEVDIAAESAGSLNVEDMGDVIAAMDVGGASGDAGRDHGGRSSMMRDEIDVDIDDVFTRGPEDDEIEEEFEVGMASASMDDDFEELDRGSFEALPEEFGLRSDEMSADVVTEPDPIAMAEESIADEDEEDTAQDPLASDLSHGFDDGAEELLESNGGTEHDDFLAVEMPDIVDIRPSVYQDDSQEEQAIEEPALVVEPPPAVDEAPVAEEEEPPPPEIDVELDVELDEPELPRHTPEADLDFPDIPLERGTVEPEDSEPSIEDDLALEPNEPVAEDSDSLDDEYELEIVPKTEPPQPQLDLESEGSESTTGDGLGPEESTGQDDLPLEEEPSYDDEEPTSSDDDLLADAEEDSLALRKGSEGKLDLVLERSLEEDGDFDDMLADMANAIEDEYGTPDVATGDAHTRADETDPDLDEIDLALGYYEVGLFEEALREFQSAFASGADSARALLYIGRCQRELGSLEEANASLQLALEDTETGDPIYLDLMFEMGLTYEDQRQPRLARGMYEQILEIDESYRGGEVAKRFMALADT